MATALSLMHITVQMIKESDLHPPPVVSSVSEMYLVASWSRINDLKDSSIFLQSALMHFQGQNNKIYTV